MSSIKTDDQGQAAAEEAALAELLQRGEGKKDGGKKEGGKGGARASVKPPVESPDAPASADTPTSNGSSAAEAPSVRDATVEQLVAEVAELRLALERRHDPELDQHLLAFAELEKEIHRRHAAKKAKVIEDRKRKVAELADQIILDPDDDDVIDVRLRRRPPAPDSPAGREEPPETRLIRTQAELDEERRRNKSKKSSGVFKSIGEFFGASSDKPDDEE